MFLYTELPIYTKSLLYNLSYYFSSRGSIGSIVAYATSTNSLSSVLSSCDTWLIRSVIINILANYKVDFYYRERVIYKYKSPRVIC